MNQYVTAVCNHNIMQPYITKVCNRNMFLHYFGANHSMLTQHAAINQHNPPVLWGF